MNTIHALGKSASIAVLLAATGLPGSPAMAQFHLEHSVKDETRSPKASAEKEERSVVEISSDDGDHKYQIRLVNGEVVSAKVDGKAIGEDRIRVKDGVVALLARDGGVLREFEMPMLGGPPAPPAPPSWTPDHNAQGREIQIREMQAPARTNEANRGSAWGDTKPRVMLGINLSEPSAALRKQLRLADDAQTILVERVIEGLPADKAGLRDYDVIVSIDGDADAGSKTLGRVLKEKEAGETLKLVVLREGERLKLDVKLAAYDERALGNTAPIIINRSDLIETGDQNAPDMQDMQDMQGTQSMGAIGRELRELARQRILEALRSQGISSQDSAEVDGTIRDSLQWLEEGVRRAMENRRAPGGGFTLDIERVDDGSGNQPNIFRLNRSRAEADALANEAGKHQELAETMRAKANEAMRDAQRQIMELRDGKLIVRSADELHDRLRALSNNLPDQLAPGLDPEQLHRHLSDMDRRLGDLESRLDDQMERMSQHIEKLSAMFERIIDKLDDRQED